MSSPRLIRSGLRDLLPMQRSGSPLNHVSAIIRYLCIKLGHFEQDDNGDEVPIERQNLWGLGSAFEEAVVLGLSNRYHMDDPDRYMRPGELELDDLIGSPDLLDLLHETVVEIKLTKLSANQDVEGEKFWKYWVQLKAYLKMMGWTRGELHVAHIMGDYRQKRDPIYNVWEQVFTQRELDDNWKMLISEGRKLRAAAAGRPIR